MEIQGEKQLMRSYDKKNHQYDQLVSEMQTMIDNRGRGAVVAEALNDEFWQELEVHQKRMKEQMSRIKNVNQNDFAKEFQAADSLYEAARNFLNKYQ